MSQPGSNLPEFRSVQLDFAAHIRNPELNPKPADVEARRMRIYADLFYNNIKNFLDSAFPVAAEVLGDARWHALAREFVHLHGSESPYFLQISEEFLTFLNARGLDDLPPFLLELCHYEWVELALDVAPSPDLQAHDPNVPLTGHLVLSPLVRSLAYTYPVHQIGVANQPAQAPSQATYLLVYRNAKLNVRFVGSNPVTHRLLELLADFALEDALQQIYSELVAGGRQLDRDSFNAQARDTLEHLHELGIILGVSLVDS